MNFWNFFWLLFVAFAFIAYLSILLSVVRDIFRDDKHSGLWKAVWFLFLVFVPFLTALVYLIIHSRDMAEHQAKAQVNAQAEVQDYIRRAAGRNAAGELAEAAQLLKDGVLSEAEFAQLKAKVLADAS
ncbi:Phospholipase_D-nuclease N-terminal [Sanguibacter gelidistatuariae]|uniref:Phospholipase_D-nuclease N-terminal n=1 Tax=Sanguibacter gelidistatuariae TaxID=1814289 RepID=A0A1G6U9D6_9MICO|nr:SHOCT domain-containing protein [Sanguibacter gelidistatuariae]SDD37834.1 Phospholipase_D-nuclease N-terminal [Sanguibacter gelidistatuariae]